ncbi:MAG: BrnT family toxin [Maricaulaceae bacterium]|nr:BrnT family toxin [Maricaulaceae bacterium]
MVRISFDPAKRAATLEARGLDFADAAAVFAGMTFNRVDDRRDYGETRVITIGRLRGRLMVLVWTQRGDARHVISMRKANEREKARFQARLG